MATTEVIAGLKAIADAYDAALIAVLNNQAYEMPDGRKLTRASLKDIQAGRRDAHADLAAATGARGRGRVRRGWVQ